MSKNNVPKLAVLFMVLASSGLAVAQRSQPKNKTAPAEPQLRGPNTKEGASQAHKSAQVLNEIMGVPDKGIPRDLLAKAECVAVFPKVVKAGFIVGGEAGRGVASCRTPLGWSAPAFFEIKGGSIGLQIGGQSTDFVLLFMNESGMRSLLSDKFELGGDASLCGSLVGEFLKPRRGPVDELIGLRHFFFTGGSSPVVTRQIFDAVRRAAIVAAAASEP